METTIWGSGFGLIKSFRIQNWGSRARTWSCGPSGACFAAAHAIFRAASVSEPEQRWSHGEA